MQQLYQIYADRISIALPSEEPVDARVIKNLDVDGADKTSNCYDSDDDIIKCFNVVVEPTNENSSTTASSVSVNHLCSLATFPSHSF